MSDFDLQSVQPIANNWLQTEIKYSGYGEAHFQDPKGIVYGPTEVTVQENGDYQIKMEVEKIDYNGDPLPLELQQLFSKEPPKEVDGKLQLSYPPLENNMCELLSITAADGQIMAHDFDSYSWTFNFNVKTGMRNFVHFQPANFEFRTLGNEKPKYWAVPLNNFLSSFQQHESELAFHPLRIYPSMRVPIDVPDDKREIAEFIAHQKNQLIVFEYRGNYGFIEPLADYKDRENKLKSKDSLCTTTSVMVGDIDNQSIEYMDVINWFPTIYIDLLSFVTGIEVGIPWIEIHSSSGQLIRRFHVRMGSPLYVKGAKVIDEVFHRGTGVILSEAFNCLDIDESYLRATFRMITKGGRYGQSVEDKMNYLCRAFETLAEHFGFQKQNLLALSDAKTISQIKKVVSSASRTMRQLVEENEKANKSDVRFLKTIEGRIANVANTDTKFGLSVIQLLERFGFHDAKIVDAFLSNNPRPDGINDFASLLSAYRGRTIHAGYFDFRGKSHDLHDVWAVIQHLHDLLVRIMLKILSYRGKYQPTTVDSTMDMPLDWVKSDTKITWLGYGKGKLKTTLMTISKDVPPVKGTTSRLRKSKESD